MLGHWKPLLESLLCMKEQCRAAQFVFERDKIQFVCCRAILRLVLANQLECTPNEVHFTYNSYGKPQLDLLQHKINIHFNVSHTEGFAVIATSKLVHVGIDLEKERSINNLSSLMHTTLSYQEISRVNSLPKKLKNHAFLHYWSRKEAILKGLGVGLTETLSQYDLGDWQQEHISVKLDEFQAQRWTIIRLTPGNINHAYDETFCLERLIEKFRISQEAPKLLKSIDLTSQSSLMFSSQYVGAIAFEGLLLPITHTLVY